MGRRGWPDIQASRPALGTDECGQASAYPLRPSLRSPSYSSFLTPLVRISVNVPRSILEYLISLALITEGVVECKVRLIRTSLECGVSLNDHPGYLGRWSGGQFIILIHADWPNYPGGEGAGYALAALGRFPAGTDFTLISD